MKLEEEFQLALAHQSRVEQYVKANEDHSRLLPDNRPASIVFFPFLSAPDPVLVLNYIDDPDCDQKINLITRNIGVWQQLTISAFHLFGITEVMLLDSVIERVMVVDINSPTLGFYIDTRS